MCCSQTLFTHAKSVPSCRFSLLTGGRINGLSRLMQSLVSLRMQIWLKFASTILTDTNISPSVFPRRKRIRMAQSPASFALRVRFVVRLPGCVQCVRPRFVPNHSSGRIHQHRLTLPCGILRRICFLHTRGALKSWRAVGSRGRRPNWRLMCLLTWAFRLSRL